MSMYPKKNTTIRRAGIGTKRYTPTFKQSFIGLSKKEAMAILTNDYEHGIRRIDYFETLHGIPSVIYVDSKMALYFDKDTRRIYRAW